MDQRKRLPLVRTTKIELADAGCVVTIVQQDKGHSLARIRRRSLRGVNVPSNLEQSPDDPAAGADLSCAPETWLSAVECA